MSEWLRELRYAVADTTAAGSAGLLTWRRPDSAEPVYLDTEIGIHGLVMPESPDEAVTLNLYPVQERPDTIVGAQFRYRARSDGRLDLIEDALSNIWTDRWGGTLGSVRLVLASWASGASLGQDQNGRLERSVNYYLRVERPLAHRTT